MNPRQKTIAACNASVLEQMRTSHRIHKLPRASRPVDCTDAERFPEIARAVEHARRMRGEA